MSNFTPFFYSEFFYYFACSASMAEYLTFNFHIEAFIADRENTTNNFIKQRSTGRRSVRKIFVGGSSRKFRPILS